MLLCQVMESTRVDRTVCGAESALVAYEYFSKVALELFGIANPVLEFWKQSL